MSKRLLAAACCCLCLAACSSQANVRVPANRDPCSPAAQEEMEAPASGLPEGASSEAEGAFSEESIAAVSGPLPGEIDLGGFFLSLPEDWVAEGDTIYEGNVLDGRRILEISAVDPIAGEGDLFASYDQVYAGAERVDEGTFGGFPAKAYFLQEEVTAGGMTGFENQIVYCISLDDRMVVLTFYPARGIGIATQREELEQVLDSIRV